MARNRGAILAAAIGLSAMLVNGTGEAQAGAPSVSGRPATATSANNWTAVAYEDGAREVHLRQYHGAALVRDQVLGSAAEAEPTVGVDGTGNAVVAWRKPSHGIAIRSVSATTGALSPIRWQPDTAAASDPRISVNASGAYVLIWADDTTQHVEIAGYQLDGTATYAPVQVDADGNATSPAVGIDAAGGAAIAWQSGSHIAFARITATGAVNRSSTTADAGTGALGTRSPAVGTLANGDFVIAWSADIDGTWLIHARGFGSGLASRFAEMAAFPSDTQAESSPVIGTDDTGGFVLAWQTGSAGYVAGFNSDGSTASRYPRHEFARQQAIAVGVDTYDASFGITTVDGNGRLDTEFGQHNLTSPGAAITVPLTSVDAAGTTMSEDTSDLAEVTAAEKANPALAPQPISAVLASANSTARPLCHDTHSTPPATGFCWDDTYGDDSNYAYVPQGLTQLDVDGRRLLVASWYSTYDNPSGTNYVRITFADITDPLHITYRHVLAVDPTGDSQVFAPELGHADAIVGSGHYLLLASGGDSFDVFDLHHIWKMNGNTGAVGKQTGGTFSASWHLWAMPRVARFHYPVSGCGTYFGDLPCITSASLDTSTNPATLVTTEGGLFNGPQDFTQHTADIVRWPIDPATALPKLGSDGTVHATARLRTNIPGIQGGTSYRGEYVFAGPCPQFVPGMYNIPSCLYKSGLHQRTELWTRGGINLENVFYASAQNQLWTLSESPRSRVVYHLPLR